MIRRPLERVGTAILRRTLGDLEVGHLRVVLPAGETLSGGRPGSSLRATLRVEDRRFFRRLLFGADLGFAESYMAGEWSSDDLVALIRIFAENRHLLDGGPLSPAGPRRRLDRLVHRLRRNSRRGSRRNVARHYDLGNDFFQLFLDPTMTYSCAIFDDGDDLEAAQHRKLRAILEKARVEPHHHVLEIGSGWGSFALSAALRVGCRVTTVTLSERQYDWVRGRIRASGLGGRVDVRLADYREIEGRFDRIVSIEMLEAVGHEHLGSFFAACDRLLRPGGLLVLQVITIRDQLYDAYRKGCDFIQRHIFPGGHLPSLAALSTAVARHSRFRVEDLENIGCHYATTLRHWSRRFMERAEDLRALGHDATFLRKWHYYFSYCEAGFAAGMLGDLQLVLAAPADPVVAATADPVVGTPADPIVATAAARQRVSGRPAAPPAKANSNP